VRVDAGYDQSDPGHLGRGRDLGEDEDPDGADHEIGRRRGRAEWIDRLEHAGVIQGYQARLDPRALGLALSAVIRVRPAPCQLERIAPEARGVPRSSIAAGSPGRTAS
jgi:hypothetical protein